jgi:hypothetical protein
VVSENVWTIRKMSLEGKYNFIKFKINATMGEEGSDTEFVPVYLNLYGDFNFIGNHLSMDCGAWFKYKMVSFEKKHFRTKKKRAHAHDLSESYQLTCDTAGLSDDIRVMEEMRHIPLSVNEDSLYRSYFLDRKKNVSAAAPKNPRLEFWGQIGDALMKSYDVNLSGIGSVKCSPLINPVMFSYSHSNGYSYKQKFKFNRLTQSGKSLRIVPQIGFNFTQKELYAKMDADYVYMPEKQGSLGFSVGNGNRIYSSVVLDRLKSFPDSVFDFNKFSLDYFKDIYFNVYHSIEPVNGLSIKAGISMHWRRLINDSKIVLLKPLSDKDRAELRGIRSEYNTFAPRIRVEWTPGMYYYMNGNRKMNVGSEMPTFSVDYERSLKGVLGGTASHERIEFDVQHKILLGRISSLGYRIGGGIFHKTEKCIFLLIFVNFLEKESA